MANQILLDYAGTPRHRWHQVWRAPGTPRMCPEILLDRYTETGPMGRTIKEAANLEELPTIDEWLTLFPDEPAPVPVTQEPTPAPAPAKLQIILCPGYLVTRVRIKTIPPLRAGAWASPAEYEKWAGEQRKLHGAINALGAPFYVGEGYDGTVLQALAGIEPALDEDQATRLDLSLWWDRIEIYAPGHNILAYREFIEAINDERPVGAV